MQIYEKLQKQPTLYFNEFLYWIKFSMWVSLEELISRNKYKTKQPYFLWVPGKFPPGQFPPLPQWIPTRVRVRAWVRFRLGGIHRGVGWPGGYFLVPFLWTPLFQNMKLPKVCNSNIIKKNLCENLNIFFSYWSNDYSGLF